MKPPYKYDTIQEAEQLYVVKQFSLEDIAKSTGIAGSTLKRWAAKHQWHSKRSSFQAGESNLYSLFQQISKQAKETNNIGQITIAAKLYEVLKSTPSTSNPSSQENHFD